MGIDGVGNRSERVLRLDGMVISKQAKRTLGPD